MHVMLAARLLAVSAALLLLPGLLLLAALRVRTEWPHRIVLAFSLSYSWVFVLSIVVPLFKWSVDYAGVLTVILLAGLGSHIASHLRPHALAATRPSREALLMAAVIIACAVCAWVIEPPFTGEEALDMASVSRFADGGPITFDNTSLLPNARTVYLFQPYQLAVGLIARWSGTDPIVAYLKFRTFLAPLTLIFLYSLLRWLTATRMEAGAAFAVVLLFTVLDMTTSQWDGWFPFVRRGGVGAGICVPALMSLCLAATRRAESVDARLARRLALATAPVMLTASLATHPLEMFPLLFFAAGLALAIMTALDPSGARKPAIVLILSLAVATGAYMSILSHAVPDLVAYGADEKPALWANLRALGGHPLTALAGPSGFRDLLTRTLPSTTVTVFGIPALVLVALRAPAAAAMLALGIVPLALLYASSAGFMLLRLATASSVVKDVNAYFGLLGLLSLAIGLPALIQVGLQAAAWRPAGVRRVIARSVIGAMVVWSAWRGGQAGVQWFADRATMQPEFLLLVAVAVAVAVIVTARTRRTLLPPSAFPSTLIIVLAAGLAVPLAAPEWTFGGVFTSRRHVALGEQLRDARASPSVLDWPAYYEKTLRQSIAPPIPVPGGVMKELRKRIPPRSVVLADPRYSCALVVLFSSYCINPETIYNGLYFRTAERYHAEYVRRGDGGIPEHPFFNANATLTASEARLLTEYRVSFLLTDPDSTDRTAEKLTQLGNATLEMEHDGYRLYRINGS